MKDPLQQSKTPYEILGVEPGVSDSSLRLALFNTIKKKKINPTEAREAYNILLRPDEQAKIGLTQYNPESLKLLVPCPLKDPSSLELKNRASTAIAWENSLKETFPDIGTIHSLAVLWYWWANHEEERYSVILDAVDMSETLACGKTSKRALLQSIRQIRKCNPNSDTQINCSNPDCPWWNDCCQPAPSLEKMWQKVIAYWSTLEVMPEFWLNLSKLSTWKISGIKNSFMKKLHSHFLDLSRQYSDRLKTNTSDPSKDTRDEIPLGWGGMSKALQDALKEKGIHSIGDILRTNIKRLTQIKGINLETAEKIHSYARKMRRRNADLPQEYYMLAQLFKTERQTAEAVIEVGVKRRNGKDVRCGVLMLTDLGYLDAVKIALEAKLIHIQDNPKLNSLKRHLSPHIYIILLLDENKADAAIEAIECMPIEQRNSQEVQDLLARAFSIKANQKASVERYDEALENWGYALQAAHELSLIDDIRSTIISRCKTRAVTLQRLQPDLAISILDKANQLVQDQDLGHMLGDTLAQCAVDKLNKTYKYIQEKGTNRECLLSLKKVIADLERGSFLGSKTAKDSLEAAKNILKSAESGILSLHPKILEYVNKGIAAANGQQWIEAIKWFRQAIEIVGKKAPDELKKNLASCLANDAVSKINSAMMLYSQKTQQYDNQIAAFLGIGGSLSPFTQRSFGTAGGCAHCGSFSASPNLGGYPYGGAQWAKFNHPQHGTFQLCQSCAQSLQAMINRRPKPDQSTINTLNAVAEDLYEASDLDPTGAYVNKSLEDVRKLASNLGLSLPQQRSQRRRKGFW